jgi:glucan phosphoethanolaminetransferase (alkaline phosphatase superfamily)
MIQRIQSIFLLLVSILMGLTVFLPIWGKEIGADKIEMNAIKMIQTLAGDQVMQQTTIYLGIIAGLTAILAFGNIFNFKNRPFQMKITLFCTLLIAIFIGVATFITFQAQNIFSPEMGGTFALGYFFPVAAILFNWLSLRFIKKDDDMVRSADRLR